MKNSIRVMNVLVPGVALSLMACSVGHAQTVISSSSAAHGSLGRNGGNLEPQQELKISNAHQGHLSAAIARYNTEIAQLRQQPQTKDVLRQIKNLQHNIARESQDLYMSRQKSQFIKTGSNDFGSIVPNSQSAALPNKDSAIQSSPAVRSQSADLSASMVEENALHRRYSETPVFDPQKLKEFGVRTDAAVKVAASTQLGERSPADVIAEHIGKRSSQILAGSIEGIDTVPTSVGGRVLTQKGQWQIAGLLVQFSHEPDSLTADQKGVVRTMLSKLSKSEAVRMLSDIDLAVKEMGTRVDFFNALKKNSFTSPKAITSFYTDVWVRPGMTMQWHSDAPRALKEIRGGLDRKTPAQFTAMLADAATYVDGENQSSRLRATPAKSDFSGKLKSLAKVRLSGGAGALAVGAAAAALSGLANAGEATTSTADRDQVFSNQKTWSRVAQ